MKEKLIILETSDIHGAILPIQYGTNSRTDVGLAKLSSYIKELQQTDEHVLLIDNGDFLQGTPLAANYVRSNQEEAHPMVKAMNHLSYDAAILGNHEFNYGLGVLERAARDADFPFLSCNIVNEEEEPFLGCPYIIKEFANGMKAAVLGVSTHYIPNWEKPDHISGLKFLDAVESVKKWVEYIHRHEQPDVMVVSYHGGFEVNLSNGEWIERKEKGENQAYRICTEVDGIDILLTGHQHRRMAETVNGVTVVQPGFSGESIGQVTLELAKGDGRYIIESATPHLIDAKTLKTDQDLIKLVEREERDTQRWLDEVIGYVEGDMKIDDPLTVRLAEHPLIELINRVQMEAAGADISSTALFHNGSPGLPNQVTMRDIVANYIYPNSLMVIEISGDDMRRALERSASYFSLDHEERPVVNPKFIYPKPQHYNYDMWEGISYCIDLTKAEGSRVVSLTHQGEEVKSDRMYQVVMNNYRAGGGGDYFMFKGRKVLKEIQTDMSELLARHFKKHGKVEAAVNHNWTIWYPGK
ncbi:2',3'-cyclic-nucleotide 2'-phosphodiesterase/3'-nucleotidase [Bacillus ectoiniformans]|uniref:bifunctional metallophosphatase/5'-nucleotidase n=1 Tax=Bacillus ectoiniformans TaxID=1494429 RepID=UPI0019582834|nr:bifunctional UDP-sugar hydrolase/5'-nucleotidase [Bacillus ectoiniformans]MBM7647326.1 2',3'-cyclic-nucleotide 2'-phosphodiesterase/3'-nucleotidase [Bacillus ectoiniformans]